MRLRVLIVDDEPVARARLRRLLASEPGVVIAGECDGVDSATAALRHGDIDLLLLDVQMPGRSGLDLLNQVDPARRPLVILVTAHDRYAVPAFDLEVLDFLLKPVRADRLAAAIQRARLAAAARKRELVAAAAEEETAALLAPDGQPPLERILIRLSRRRILLRLDQVDWIEAADNYVWFHTGTHRYLYRTTLQRLERRLDPRRFARIHRSRIVNLDRIAEIRTTRSGDAILRLESGVALRSTRTYREQLSRHAP
jgi:two-component system LytT family response regulator